jgi:hypothetical protein
MTIQKAPKCGIRKTADHVEYEAPRIGNRSDALDLLDKIIEEVDDAVCYSDFIGTALETLRDAIEREIV